MSGNGVPAGVILLPDKQQQATAQQAVVNQLFLGMYVPLVPQLTIYRLARGYEVEGGLSEAATPQRIAEEAGEIVQAAMARLGFQRG